MALVGEAGIELGRERSVGQILRATLDLYRAFPVLLLILAAAVMVPYDLAVLGATGHGPFGRGHDGFLAGGLLSVLSFSLYQSQI